MMPPETKQQMLSLEAAARLTRDKGLATWAVVGRRPGVAENARLVADRLGLRVEVVIDSATIAVRFVRAQQATADHPPSGETPENARQNNR